MKIYIKEPDHDDIHEAFGPVRDFAESLNPSRERSLLLTKLDEAKMWAFAHFRVKEGGQP